MKLKIPWIKYFFFGCDCVRCSDALHCTSLRRFYFLLCVFSFYFWSGSTLFSTTLMNESRQRRQQPTSYKPKWKKKWITASWHANGDVFWREATSAVYQQHTMRFGRRKRQSWEAKLMPMGNLWKLQDQILKKKYINCVVNAVIGNFVSVVRLRGTEIFSYNHGKWLNAPNKCDQPLEQ